MMNTREKYILPISPGSHKTTNKKPKGFVIYNSILFVFAFVFLIYFSSAYDFTSPYLRLCRDSSCENTRGVYQLSEGYTNIRAFGFDSSALEGEITLPDGSVDSLSFSSFFFFSSDKARISFSGNGIYKGRVWMNVNETRDKEIRFMFNVVASLPRIVDRSQKCGDGIVDSELGEECDDGNSVNFDGCSVSCRVENGCEQKGMALDRYGASGSLGELSNNAVKLLDVTKENASYFIVISNPEWNCNSEVACLESNSSERMLIYEPVGEDFACSGIKEGNFSVKSSLNLFEIFAGESGRRQSLLNEMMTIAGDEMGRISNELSCEEGCTKSVSLGMKSIAQFGGILPGADANFVYRMECTGVRNINSFNVTSLISESKRCVG